MYNKSYIMLPGLLLFLVSFCACVSPSSSSSTSNAAAATAKYNYRLLSKKEASKWIVIDEKEQFFEKVAPLEMSIQMKQNLEKEPQAKVVEQYKKMIQDDLVDFTEDEKVLVKELFDRAMSLSFKVNPKLKLPEIYLIKTAGKYYGDGVFYTRDNSIVIPAPMLKMMKDGFVSTMIHEIFHVYSRYNKDKRDALYERIGFEKLSNINLSDFLKERVLYNPDGVDLRYAIDVKDKKTGKEFKAIPAIYSRYKAYTSDMPAFFGYLTFQLFEIRDRAGVWSVVDKDVGHSIEDLTGFWEQVGENTQYNIHPDEICADNFVIMALSKENKGENLKALTDEGRQLVKDLEAIIKK